MNVPKLYYSNFNGWNGAGWRYLQWGVTTSQAYFPKDSTKEFDNDLTIADWLTGYSEIKDATYVRGFLGRMLFPGEDGVKKSVYFPVVKK